MEAVLFDFDGVLLESSQQLYQGYAYVLKQFGIDYSEEEFNSNYGLKTKEHLGKVLSERGQNLTDAELDALVKKRDIFYRKLCDQELTACPGVNKLLDEIKKHGVKIGLGSSTHRDNLDFFLEKLGIKKYFEVIVAGNEVKRGKPDPFIYLKCCEALGVDPRECVGIEDTDKEVAALKAAGAKAIAVTLTNRKEYDFSNADLVVKTLEEVDWDTLNNF